MKEGNLKPNQVPPTIKENGNPPSKASKKNTRNKWIKIITKLKRKKLKLIKNLLQELAPTMSRTKKLEKESYTM